jgi:hypothetical protein
MVKSAAATLLFFEKNVKKIQKVVDGGIINCYVCDIAQDAVTHTQRNYKMEKMFAVAGMSNLDGKVKVRFANEMARVKVLEKNGHTDVRLVALAAAMTKDAAVAALMVHADFQDAAAQAVLAAYGEDEKPARAPKAPKLTLEDMPKRDGKGHFIKRETREEMLLAKLAEMAPKKRVVRTAEEQAAINAKRLKTIKEVHQRMQADNNKDVALLDADVDADDVDLNDLGVELPEYDLLDA